MGNNPSKSGSGSSGGPSSPHAQSHPHSHAHHNPSTSVHSVRHRPHRSQPPQTHAYQPHSRDSTHSATVSTISSTGSPTSNSPIFTPHTTLSPQTSKSSQHHYRAASADSSPVQRSGDGRMGNSQSGDASRDKEARRREREHNVQSDPVQVPTSGQQRRNRGPSTQFEPSGPPQNDDYAPKSNLNFPPRLPLPIQEEVYTPGSPIIAPEDLSTALNDDDLDGPLPHRTSLLSHTTADEDEEGIDFELDPAKGKTVPTTIEWRGYADKVYITGTFAAWSRKYRMHRDPENPGILNTRLDLPPGTHHVKFIVDGEMQLSNNLPTAVDYTNILVNYIEVSADDIPSKTPSTEKPPEGLHPPLSLPPETQVQETDFAEVPEKPKEEKQPSMMPPQDIHYGQKVPTYLQDLDRAEDSNRFRRGAHYVAEIPPPPSLPLFLGKSILNGTTPMKDDSSVLNMPNHTVLNHLATSSIKNDVLATSVTTRYKRKYVTTITYKPSNPND